MYVKVLKRTAVIIVLILSFSCAGTLTQSSKKDKAKVLERLGNSLFVQGNAREGLAKLLDAEKLDPSSPYIQHEIALVYMKLNQFDLSLQHFKRAIDLKPDFSDAYNNMGILYSQKGDWKNALTYFNKALSNILYRTPQFAYHNMGLVYFQMKDYTRAIELYKKAISLSPDYTEAYFDLAHTYEVLGENDKAVDTYEKIIELKPDSLPPYLALAKLYRKTGQIDAAYAKLNYIVGTDPRSPIAREAIKMMEEIKSR